MVEPVGGLEISINRIPKPLDLRWTPDPVIVTIRDNSRDYIRVLLYSYFTTITIRDNRDYIRVLLYSCLPLLQGGGPPNLDPSYS